MLASDIGRVSLPLYPKIIEGTVATISTTGLPLTTIFVVSETDQRLSLSLTLKYIVWFPALNVSNVKLDKVPNKPSIDECHS